MRFPIFSLARLDAFSYDNICFYQTCMFKFTLVLLVVNIDLYAWDVCVACVYEIRVSYVAVGVGDTRFSFTPTDVCRNFVLFTSPICHDDVIICHTVI